MARVHGRGTTFVFDGVGLTDELRNVTQTSTVSSADITSFGDAYQNSLAGKPNHSWDIDGALDTAAAQGHKTLFGAIGAGVKTAVFSPDAGTTTYTTTASGLTGALINSYRISLPVGDTARYSATIQVSNTLTHS